MRLVTALMIAAVLTVPALAAGDGGGHRFPPFDARTFPGQIFWLILSFGALYLLMSRVALPRVGAVLEHRRETIAGNLQAAETAQKQAEDAAQAHEQALTRARANAQAIAQEARAKSAREIDAKRQDVEQDLARKMIAAEQAIAATKAKAMENVGEIAREAASAIIEQLGGKKPTAAALNKALGAAAGE